MANHKSAEKRNRQNLRRYERNKVYRTHVKTATKKVLSAVENGEKEAAQEALHQAMTTISRVASKGVLHSNAAARKISNLSRKVHQMNVSG